MNLEKKKKNKNLRLYDQLEVDLKEVANFNSVIDTMNKNFRNKITTHKFK